MKKKRISTIIMLTLSLIMCMGVCAYASASAEWTSKAVSGQVGDVGDQAKKYKITKAYSGDTVYMAYQNDGTDVKQLRVFLRKGASSTYTLWSEGTEASAGKIKAYWNPSITFGNASRGRYVFYYSKKDSSGKWTDYPTHSLDVFRNRTHSQSYHGKQAWTSVAATGDFMSTTEVVASKAVSSCYTGDTVYATIQNCAGCKDTLADNKAYRLYLKKPGEASFTQVKSDVKSEGNYITYCSVPYTFTEPGTYEMYFVTDFWKGDNYPYDSVKKTLTVSKRSANLKFEASELSKKYSENTFKNPLTKSTTATVTYTSSNPNVATVASDGTVTMIGIGTTTIKASAASNTKYNSGSASYNLTVEKGIATVNCSSSVVKYYGTGRFLLNASAPTQLYCVAYDYGIADPEVDNSDIYIRIGEVGTTKITVSSVETDKYYGSSKDVTIKVIPKAPVLKYKKLSSTKGKISWAKVQGATSYRVYKYNTKTKKYAYIGSKKTNYINITSKKKKTMKFKVKAVRKGVYSPYSGIKKVTLGK